MFKGFFKIFRFFRIYGFARTWFKIAGRARFHFGYFRPFQVKSFANIGVIGCGQFSFATIGYFLSHLYISRFVDCFDIDNHAQSSFADFYRISKPSTSALDLIHNPNVVLHVEDHWNRYPDPNAISLQRFLLISKVF